MQRKESPKLSAFKVHHPSAISGASESDKMCDALVAAMWNGSDAEWIGLFATVRRTA